MFHFGKNYKDEYDALGVIYTDLQREYSALEKERTALIRVHHELEAMLVASREQVVMLRAERDETALKLAKVRGDWRIAEDNRQFLQEKLEETQAELVALKQPALAIDIKQSRTRKKPLAKVESNNG